MHREFTVGCVHIFKPYKIYHTGAGPCIGTQDVGRLWLGMF